MKKLIVPALFAVLLIVPFSSAAQSGNTLDQVFAKIDEASKSFKSIESNIERTKVTVLVDDRDVSSGKFYYARRGKMPRLKLELTKPALDYVLIDNEKFQHYVPKIKQVQEAFLGGRRNQVETFMAIGFGQTSQELKANWDVTLVGDETLDGQRTTVLELKPKSGGMFKSVRIWMDPQKWISLQIKLTEVSNDYMIMKYTSPRVNSGIPDSRFKLDLPKDVKIIKL